MVNPPVQDVETPMMAQSSWVDCTALGDSHSQAAKSMLENGRTAICMVFVRPFDQLQGEKYFSDFKLGGVNSDTNIAAVIIV